MFTVYFYVQGEYIQSEPVCLWSSESQSLESRRPQMLKLVIVDVN